ncbi:MAG: beta-galactosidase [Phyllobacteriaceae bacterium]|jgi:beta-galactosidase|nr:beta-galactosidase [Phyllobacteriaceae bacterium]
MSLGVCYYPEHWPEDWWAVDARRMREAGISYVRIGEFAWSRYEPERGRFDWGWLDRAIDCLGKAGLKVVLGTPTATPPKWLIDETPEILPVDEQGRPRGFGSRRHYTFSSEVYWTESRRIVEILSKRYGNNPHIAGWQTDNEFGCHDTVLSWGEVDLKAFRSWLRRRYQSTDQLNAAWGNAFWSMDVQNFDQVALPNLAVTETNPAARLDFWRFHSQQVAAYNKMQVEIIRAHSPGRWVTHNMMGFFNEYDHWDVSKDIDFPSWDSYPLGYAQRFLHDDAESVRWAETGHPDIAPLNNDLYRSMGAGKYWIMELQPGPVNWAPWNPVPKPGMVRLWAWEALAHGAEVVSYFRWRQAVSGQEQMHAGLNLPGQHEWSPGGKEACQLGAELAKLGPLPASEKAPVAIVYDYEAYWITRIQPQGRDFDFVELMFRWYSEVRKLGLDVDFVRPGGDLKGYKLVLVPTMPYISDGADNAFAIADGIVLYGPRTGSKNRHHAIPANLPPGPIAKLVGARVLQVASLRPGLKVSVKGKVAGTALRWKETVETLGAQTLAKFAGGEPALVATGRYHYLACWPDEMLLVSVIKFAAAKAKLKTIELPDFIRLRRRGKLLFVMNYGEKPWTIPLRGKVIMGGKTVKPHDIAIVEC